MDEYLDNYIIYLSNFKKSISIADTETYISSHRFDIEMISNPDESHINLESFIGFLNSRKFYKGHSTSEKFRLLFQCLEILHNYSKNLLVNFSTYSTKSIQEVTPNIRDYLAHLPYYSSYLSDSLGYEFDPIKHEWFIKHKSLSEQHKLRLAAACVLCAYIRVKLMEMQLDDDQQSSSPDIDQQPHASINTVEYSSTKWACPMCEVLNADCNMNCVVCYTSRLQLEEPCQSEYTARSSKIRQTKDPSSWECPSCTFCNNENNTNCEVCDTPSAPKDPILKWKCERCTFRNSQEALSCFVCNEPRSGTDSAQQINNPNARVEVNLNHFIKNPNSPIKDRTYVGEGRINHPSRTVVSGSHKRPAETSVENSNNIPKTVVKQMVHHYGEINDVNNRTDETNTHSRADKYKRKEDANMAAHNTNMDFNRRPPETNTEPVRTSKYRRENRTPHSSNPDISKYSNSGGGTVDKSQHHGFNSLNSPKSGMARPAKPIEGPKIAGKNQSNRTDSKIPKTAEKSSPDRRDHRPQRPDRMSGSADPIRCPKCNIDKKGHLVNEMGKRIKECQLCDRIDPKSQNCISLNCFG